ncbi:MAG: inositol phosphorylceramide synthase [Actinobacteria bacterium]|nr:inositol phosphorylceramide synthase [Actinomycetota bacterium]
MKWVTWDQAAITALLSFAVTMLLRRLPTTKWRARIVPVTTELSLISALYTLWRLALKLPLDQPSGAIERARQIDRFQHWLHMPAELSLQQFVLQHDWLAQATNFYYAVFHVPAMILFLVWIFIRHRDKYPRWRSSLAMLTAACLVIRYIRVAPPRFLPELGYIDLATRYGLSVYGPVGTGVSDQFAAMPSIHVGWAAIVSFGIVFSSTSRWRWIYLSHLLITVLAVSATGNHWWLDGVAAIAILGVALWIDRFVRNITNKDPALNFSDGGQSSN